MGSRHSILQYRLEAWKCTLGQNWNDNTLGIYLHIPFCEKKCFYCDFYSLENHAQKEEFLLSIRKEISDFNLPENTTTRADTIFFGGGTPSLLTGSELESLMDAIRSRFDVAGDAEITVECNPGTVSPDKLKTYRQLGVNRLSFGVQSFFDEELKFLSRIHDSAQAAAAVDSAHSTGFDNVNVDLMYALPGQSAKRVESNLKKALELDTTHISAYALIVEPGTPLFASVADGTVVPCDDSLEADLYRLTMNFLEDNGFKHYEVSNYAKRGLECRHNLKYWNGDNYLGFGPSAHSRLDDARWWNVSSLAKYVEYMSNSSAAISARETLGDAEKTEEYVLLKLRRGRIDLSELTSRFGVKLRSEFISVLVASEYISINGDEISLTRKGFTVCDEIAEEVLSHHAVSV